MRLVHYSDSAVGELREFPQGRDTYKPHGLWVSDDDCEDNWRSWCEGEGFGPQSLACPHDVELAPNANVLIIRSSFEIDAFTNEWKAPSPIEGFTRAMWIDWSRLRTRYQGVIITPYIWDRRLSLNGEPDAMWYYGWDCASGALLSALTSTLAVAAAGLAVFVGWAG